MPIAAWFAGIFSSRYAGGESVGTFGLILLVSGGLLAGPLVGIWTMRAIPDFFEWENSAPRDFFVPALAMASVVCFGIALLASLALA